MGTGENNVIVLALDKVGCATAEMLSSEHQILLIDCSDPGSYRLVRYERGRNEVVEARGSADLAQTETAIATCVDRTSDYATLVVLAGMPELDDWVTQASVFAQWFSREFFLPLAAVKAVLPRMMARRAGKIVVILPSSGLVTDARSAPATCAHWSLRRVCQSLRTEMEPHKVAVRLAFTPGRRRNGTSATSGLHAPETLVADLTQILEATGNDGGVTLRPGDRVRYAKSQLFSRGGGADGNGRHDGSGQPQGERTRPRSAVITGASSGLGRELARRCAAHMDVLHLVGRNMPAMEELRRELTRIGPCEVCLARVDLADLTATAEYAAQLECTEALINCAGFSVVGRIGDVPLDEFKNNMAVNFLAPVVLTCAALGRRAVPKRIVNVLSTTAIAGRNRHGCYSATKPALWAFTRMLRDAVPAGVQVVEAIPATFTSEFARNTVKFTTERKGPHAEHSGLDTRHGVTSAMVAEKIENAIRRGETRVCVPFNARLFLSLEAVAPALFRTLFK